MGFLADLLSKPILVGDMAGVAVIMITGQIGKISGVKLGAESLLVQLRELLGRSDEIHLPTLLLAFAVLPLKDDVMGRFLEKLMEAQEVKPLLSDEHCLVDGTLLQAWAWHASLERIDGEEDPPLPPSGPGEGFGALKPGRKRAKGDFRGIKLATRPIAPPSIRTRCCAGVQGPSSAAQRPVPWAHGQPHALSVHCKGTQAKGHGERDAAKAMATEHPGAHRKTIGPDENDDTRGYVVRCVASVSRRTWRKSRPALEVRPSMGAPPATTARPSRSMPAAGSRRCWAGSNSGTVCASSYRGRRPSVPEALAARHRQGECSVWAARDRLQPDPPGQPAQTGDGDDMNRWLPRGVSRRQRSGSPNRAERLQSGVLNR